MKKEFIQNLLAKMTLEEKIGQLQQCGPSVVGAFGMSFDEMLDMMFDGKITQAQFDEYVGQAGRDYREDELRAGLIGSYNGVSDARTANRIQKIAVEESRLGIPVLFGSDVIHGLCTVFPIPLGESCAWDEELWEKTAQAAAKEASAAGIHLTFGPMVDVSKDARWGRCSEGAGEDACLTARFGSAKVRGYQGGSLKDKERIMACVKHFAAYGAVEAGRDYNRVDMSLQRLFEEYMPPYEECVKAGAGAVMAAFNDINGVPCTVNEWLLKELLRKAWGFEGVIISDAFAVRECETHGIAESAKEAAQKAVEATLDIDMSSESYAHHLAVLVREGKVSEESINLAAGHVLAAKYELGLFEQPYRTDEAREKTDIRSEENRMLARKAAVKSMVLLKNNDILPLRADSRIGLAGELAELRGEMTGAWAIDAKEDECISILDALQNSGYSYTYCSGTKKEEFLQMAEACDVIVAAVGEYKNQSGEAASRADIGICPEHQRMLEWAVASGKPVVAVLFNGRPLAIPWMKENVHAILEAWHPGSEAGNAVCDILFGKENPSGKLTMSFPYSSGQCPVYYAHINTGRPAGRSKFTSKYLDVPAEPLYPFGYGLSYTSFDYENLEIKVEKEGISAKVKVTNTGNRAGEEIVQLYVQDVTGSRVRPVRQLKGFSKIMLEAGESCEAAFYLDKGMLGFWNSEMKYVTEPGQYKLYIGKNVCECLESTFEL